MNGKLLTFIVLFSVSLVSSAAFAQVMDLNKYHGGSYDGYAMGTSTPASDKYHGGSYDGYAMDTSDPTPLEDASNGENHFTRAFFPGEPDPWNSRT